MPGRLGGATDGTPGQACELSNLQFADRGASEAPGNGSGMGLDASCVEPSRRAAMNRRDQYGRLRCSMRTTPAELGAWTN